MKRLLLLIFAIVSINFSYAQAAKHKAMFICNFTKEIEWPASEKTGDFVICIVNQNDVLNQVRTFTNGKMVGTCPISVVGVKSIDEISKCHILFLPFDDFPDPIIFRVNGRYNTEFLSCTALRRIGILIIGTCADAAQYQQGRKR